MEVHVWWSSLLAADRDLLGLLDPTERARVRSLERPADQGRSMVAAALLRVAVGHHLGVAPADVVVDRTCTDCGRPHGRPRVLGPGERVPYVSVSHSGLLVVVALAADVPVGVDVQRLADLGAPPVAGAGADGGWSEREGADGGQVDGDGADGARTGWRWVRREAALKAGGADPVVRPVATPLEGYVAALASLAERPPTDGELVVRYWPDRRRPGGVPGDAGRGDDA